MHYEINVSKDGMHFFATAERSIKDYERLKRVLSVMNEKFPQSEGYQVRVTEWQTLGKDVDVSV